MDVRNENKWEKNSVVKKGILKHLCQQIFIDNNNVKSDIPVLCN